MERLRRHLVPALAIGAGSFAALAGTAGAAEPSGVASGSPHSLTIETRQYFISRIGSFRPQRDSRLSAARRAFGRPSRVGLRGSTCRVDWRRLRLRIYFENFGVRRPGQTTCTSSVGKAQSFVARGPRLRTVRGLRVGQRSSEIRVKHPDAEFQEGFWALVLAQFPFGVEDAGPSPVLSALTRDGRVSALAGYIGGAGE